MFNRFSPIKVFNSLKNLKANKKTPGSPLSPSSPVPKLNITSTIDDPMTARRNSILNRKKVTFGQQLFQKHQEKARSLVVEFVHMIVHGSKSAYKDALYLSSVVSSKPKSSYTVEEIREVKRVTRDLIKFVPFYASLIIPFGEAVLIPYLYLFPRAVPSYFLAEKAIKEEKYRYIDNQDRAHGPLKQYLVSVMAQLGFNPAETDSDAIRKFFIENKDTLMPLLSTSKMNSDVLKNASDFLMFEYVDGTYIINKLYKTVVNLPKNGVNLAMWVARNSYRATWSHPILEYNFKLNWFPVEPFKRQLIKYQFDKHLKTMKAQNSAMVNSQFGTLEDEAVLEIAKERGYTNKEEDCKKWLKDEWVNVAKTNIDDELFLFWHSVVQYESGL